ncbi:ATPase [Asticcacaulis biprosthecium C19]|uniref:ATPase n=1 Tax=Asticcacaulis biprosthecium C19 TaxID=715226 RepID=F4QRV8_9CAUL|nr:ATP-binding protein [Asticcacaulis biprosthecium]EGF89478.1 ATPase [Asticcacaulis biprosthecium C19]
MRQLDLPPRASALSESLRDLGYSLETAVADVVDNSIAAKATTIDVWCHAEAARPSLAIVDNGDGMDEATLIEAMRYGSRNPRDKRPPTDLGRFGLGMKTASFSQCRKLTVVSRVGDSFAGAEWDLDVLADDHWRISILDPDECRLVPWFDQLGTKGTLVVWQTLDRLTEHQTESQKSGVLSEKLSHLGHHLALVFHRYLAGDVPKFKKVSVRVNGHKIEGFDPFCRSNPATTPQPPEVVNVNGQDVEIHPFILPHHSKLTRTEYDFYRSRSDFLSNQGAYVYRNGRLMAWGDWFRLIPKGEATKLARVQIDFPASLDEFWTIDIKKARAHPPLQVREKLKQIIGRISDQSAVVHTGRGRKLFEKDVMPMWTRYADRGGVRYVPNGQHPLFAGFEQSLSPNQIIQFRSILGVVGISIPIEAIYADYSTAPQDVASGSTEDCEVIFAKIDQVRTIIDPGKTLDRDHLRRVIRSTRLLEGQDDVMAAWLDKEFPNG